MSSCLLSPVKTEKQIFENSMPEDDPNCNSDVIKEDYKQKDFSKPRWGPNHAGAKELASLYTRGMWEKKKNLLFFPLYCFVTPATLKHVI